MPETAEPVMPKQTGKTLLAAITSGALKSETPEGFPGVARVPVEDLKHFLSRVTSNAAWSHGDRANLTHYLGRLSREVPGNPDAIDIGLDSLKMYSVEQKYRGLVVGER